MTKFNG